jgi:hypothetical protein
MAHLAGAKVLSDAVLPQRTWPPECCVPAFLNSAMVVKHVALGVPDVLPSKLGVRVRPDQDNPLGLAIANHRYPPGIRATDADREINRFFAELELPLRFRRIPFLQITLGLWEDVLDAALAKSVVVGLGTDFEVLMQRATPRSAQHLLRVLARNGDHLDVIDDSGETTPAHFSVKADRVHKAVLAVPDGFWMIGTDQDLQLPFTLPWGGSQ